MLIKSVICYDFAAYRNFLHASHDFNTIFIMHAKTKTVILGRYKMRSKSSPLSFLQLTSSLSRKKWRFDLPWLRTWSTNSRQLLKSNSQTESSEFTTRQQCMPFSIVIVGSVWKLCYSLILILCLVGDVRGFCSRSCICKWKGGKQTVECVEKALTTIPIDLDAGTQVLDFTGNPLVIIPREKFKDNGLVNLQKIFLSRCKLVQLDDLAFKGLNNLVELDLSNNELHMIPAAALRHLPSLMRLQLSYNPITKIKDRSFANLNYLSSLELTGCSINTMEPRSFDGLDKLEWLKIDDNKLTTVPSTIDLPTLLHGVSLHNNPWNCDCHLKQLRKWLVRYNVPSTIEPKCYLPHRLKNRVIKEIVNDELACVPKVRPTSQFFDVKEGKNVSFECHVTSVPDAVISWDFNGDALENTSFLYDELTSLYIYQEEEGENERTSYLRIESVTLVHSGLFQCHAENEAGRRTSNFTLRVQFTTTEAPVKVHVVDKYIYVGFGLIALSILVIILCCILLIRCCRRKSRSKNKMEICTANMPGEKEPSSRPKTSSMPKYIQMGTPVPKVNGGPCETGTISIINTSPYRSQQMKLPPTNPDLIANSPEEKTKTLKKKVSIVGVEEMDSSGVITTRKLADIAEESEDNYEPGYDQIRTHPNPIYPQDPPQYTREHNNPYPLTNIPATDNSSCGYYSDSDCYTNTYSILKSKPWKDTNDLDMPSRQPKDVFPVYATVRRKKNPHQVSHTKKYIDSYSIPEPRSERSYQQPYDEFQKTQEHPCECCPPQYTQTIQGVTEEGCSFDHLLSSCGSNCFYNDLGRHVFDNTLPDNYRPLIGNPPPPAGYGDSDDEEINADSKWEIEGPLSPGTRVLYSPKESIDSRTVAKLPPGDAPVTV